MLELPILGLLREEPMHGYELKKRLDETVGTVAGISYGSLYPALRRLERAGAIEEIDPAVATPPSIPATGSIGGETAAARSTQRALRRLAPTRRRRKEYRITARGAEALDELLRAHDDAGDGRAFAVKLAFCRYLEPADRLRLFERRRDWLTERLARVREALGGRRRADGYTRSLMEHDGDATRRDLEWVERLIAEERERDGNDKPRHGGADHEPVRAGAEGTNE